MKKFINYLLAFIMSSALIYVFFISASINNNPIAEFLIYTSFILILLINGQWKKKR